MKIMTELIQAIAEPSRKAILLELLEGPRSVGALVSGTGLKQPNISNHLCKMREHGIVSARKEGRHVFYVIANPEVEEMVRSVMEAQREDLGDALSVSEATVRLAESALDGNERDCRIIVDNLLSQQISVIDIYAHVFSGAMVEIGKRYLRKEIDEAQEHLASHHMERLMARIMQRRGPAATTENKAILGCVAGNYHTLGLRMVSDSLQLGGWQVMFLGANVPEDSFAKLVSVELPDLVLISCAREDHLEALLSLKAALERLRAQGQSFRLGFGGHYLSGHTEALSLESGDFTATDLYSFQQHILPLETKS